MLRRWPCIVVATLCCLLALGTSAFTDVHAQSTPQMPGKVTGYGGYRFGMTLDEARRVDSRAVETKCEYVGAAICLQKDEKFFGEPGRIDALFADSDKRLTRININFNRLDGPDGACKKVADTVVSALFRTFGNPTKAEKAQGYWYPPAGGEISFTNFCINDDLGIVVVSYGPSAAF
jgi:hypothetical protein